MFSHSCNGTKYFHSVKNEMYLQLGFASLNGTFHLSPHENICTIALINIHYLYTNVHSIGKLNLLRKLLNFTFLSQYLSSLRKLLNANCDQYHWNLSQREHHLLNINHMWQSHSGYDCIVTFSTCPGGAGH